MKYKNSDFKNDVYYRQEQFKDLISHARRSGNRILINTIRKLNNCRWARKLNGEISIQDLFIEYWDEFLQLNHDKEIRPAIIENVTKMIRCRNFDYGYFFYECPNCNNFHMQGFTCKSRFCPSCGKKYRDKISAHVGNKLYKIPHRQLVFTMPFDLRPYFQKHRELLNLLFNAVKETLEFLLKYHAPIKYRKEKRKLGFVSFLHTYGRDLKWHPHIHVLYAERFLRKDGSFGNFYYLSFEAIRKAFLYILVNRLKIAFKQNYPLEYKGLYKTCNRIISTYKNGSYFYGKGNNNLYSIKSAKATAKYIARYASHPAISERRIVKIDKDKKEVTWFYDPHEDDTRDEEHKIGRQYITESIFNFMKRLIIHIPNKNFHQIRYYGFYSNKDKQKNSYKLLFDKKSIEELLLKWKEGLLASFGYNPLLCECGHEMILNLEKSFFPNKKGVP